MSDKESSDYITINTDGGSRGNPGHAASAFVVKRNNEIITSYSMYIGKATNNIAEYKALLFAFQWVLKNLDKISESKIKIIMDSELIVKQFNGLYKVKDPDLKTIYKNINDLIMIINKKTVFDHVKREFNKEADKLVNECLDNSM